jgi:hypothetical protein
MTTIQDTLNYEDGSPANGRIVVWTPPFTVGGVSVAGSMQDWSVVNGAVSITLYPNSGASPAGTYYTAKYELENGSIYEEYWVVPDLPTVTLGMVRVSSSNIAVL